MRMRVAHISHYAWVGFDASYSKQYVWSDDGPDAA